MVPATTPLVGFNGEIIWPLGKISLRVKIGDEEHSTSARMNFMVVRSPSPYNGIIGRPGATYLLRLLSNIRHGVAWTRRWLNLLSFTLYVCCIAFGLREGTFLGYKVDTDGLRVCLDKVEAVLNLPSPRCLKDVQKLNGKLASLNRFLSKSAEKSLPLFKTLKKCTKKSDFQWTTEAEIAFKQMKQSIAELPMLTAPTEKEELIMYLAVAKEAVSAVLMTEREGKQVPIYFVSRALQGPEINYTSMEKLILALVSASKRPRTSVKGQILADFIVERPEDDASDTPMEEREELPDPWVLFTNGSSCIDGSRASLIITNLEGMKFTYALRFRFNATINEAEYEALIAGLRIARQMGVQNLQANVDSKLIANQVNGVNVAKESSMIKYLEKQVLVEELREKSIDEQEILAAVEEEGHTWMTLVHEYLKEGTLPEGKKKSKGYTSQGRKHALGTQIRGSPPRYIPMSILQMENRHSQTFSERPGKVKFLIVAMDCFTKWIEAKPVATITGAQIKKFIGDNVVCRFGLPGEIVFDNGKQFRDNPFKDWEGIKGRLGEKNKNWVEEISHVLWAHRTMIKSSNGETPFSLTYGTKAVILMEIGMPTLRTAEVDMIKNNEDLGINLDLLEVKREQAVIQEAKSKAKMEKYYNARVRSTSFRSKDFVYRNNEVSHAEDEGKLGPKWEGPYEVT
ncbi:reverse transcriptase domain-containing protein [Tanacetum coccineum]